MAKQEKKQSNMELIDLRNTDVKLPNEVGTLKKVVSWEKTGKRGVMRASYIIVEYPIAKKRVIIGCKEVNMWVGKAPIEERNEDGSVQL
jgi:hypothetical protein